jgi:hypothetical protein
LEIGLDFERGLFSLTIEGINIRTTTTAVVESGVVEDGESPSNDAKAEIS